MIYLYGLIDPQVENPHLDMPGVTGGVRIERLPQGYLVFGPHDGAEIMAKRRFLLAHTRVLEALAQFGTVLPMRFGSMAEDQSEIADILSEQDAVISERFNTLAGHIEMGVRVAFPEEPALSHQLALNPTMARERARLAESAKAGHFEKAEFGRKLGELLERHRTDAQHAFVAKLRAAVVSDLVLKAPDHEYQVLHANVLLPSASEASFGETLTALAQELDFAPGAEPDVQLVGPAPLYNFVSLNLPKTQKAA